MELEPLFAGHRERLRRCRSLPPVFAGRGLTLEQLRSLELGLDEDGNGVIALRDPAGTLLGLKVRRREPAGRKYLEIPDPNGNPPWFAPDCAQHGPAPGRGVLCVEGELNAMVTSLALAGHGWRVVGLGSAFGPVPWSWLQDRGAPVVFSLDRGRVGDKSIQLWLAQSRRLGLHARRAEPLLSDWDACEYAEACGLEALAARWLQVLMAHSS